MAPGVGVGGELDEFGPPAVGGEFEALREAALRLAGRDEVPRSALEIAHQILHLCATGDIVKREAARLMGVFRETDECHNWGSVTPMDWLRHNGRMSVADAMEVDVVGKQMRSLPASSVALERGEIGFGHLVHLARTAEFCGESFDEAPLLYKAQEESVSRFRHTCLHARHAQDRKAFVEAEVDAAEQSELTFNNVDDGTTWINIRLAQGEAAIARSVLEGAAGRRGKDDHRKHKRRLADAFVECMHRLLNEKEGDDVVGRRVNITLTCSAETLLDLPGAPAADLDFGAPISAAALSRLACEAKVTRILVDGKMIPIAMSRARRTLTKAERRALNARDGGCRYPGCHRAPSSCQAHHIEWYSKGGQTVLRNMILLCPYHHWRVHEGGWTLLVNDDLSKIIAVPPYLNALARGPGLSPAA